MKGTCIVGIAHKGVVWMGCDSRASSDYWMAQMRAPKIVRVGDMLLGVCGSIRVRDVVEFLVLPDRAESISDREYLVRLFVPALRATLKDAGTLGTDSGLDDFAGNMLIAYRGKLYQLLDDFALMEQVAWSVGSGSEYALGSLFSTTGEPQKRIKKALQAACEFSPTCGPPLHIIKL